jgi:hemoglobin
LAVLLVPAVALGQGAAEPLARADLDGRIVKILDETVRTGARLYNDGDQAACFRLYQGALMAVGPLLDHRPGLQEMAMKELQRAGALRTTAEKAFALRKVIDTISEACSKEMMKPAARSLWDRLGGEPSVRAVVHDFVALAAGDPKVNFLRDGKFALDEAGVMRLEQRLVELVSAVSGGPLKYTGKDMKAAHAGMKITEEEFNALAADLITVLKKYKVPQKEIDELVGIVATTKKDIVGK